MALKELLLKNRSYRRFDESKRMTESELKEFVEMTRFCASGRNAQALKYVLVFEKAMCERLFPLLSWAGYLTDWDGPQEGERPVAYMVQVLDTRIVENCLCDDGIQAQTILLSAVEHGRGGCLIKAFKNDALHKLLQLPDYFKILYVIALGTPVEKVVLERMQGNDYKYWRDAEGVHHVPKRDVEDLIVR